jgi:N-acetylglutamate synthase-like GNAT family acetyltransferase
VKLIEEIAMNAWPSLQTMFYDGWIIRFADGYTKRANSVNPLYSSYGNVNEKISTCERLFKAKGLLPTYKMTASVSPDNLDELLERSGYRTIDYTKVLMMDVSEIAEPFVQNVTVKGYPDEKWLNDYCRLNKVREQNKITLGKILDNIMPTKYFVSLLLENEVIACGIAVIENSFVGLFDIVVDERHRNQGYGRQLLLNLLHVGKCQGAKNAYLQVLVNNLPAFRLYTKLGFKEVYKYWYRVSN